MSVQGAHGPSAEQIAMCRGCAERTLWLRMSELSEVRAAFHEEIAAGVDKASAKLWGLMDREQYRAFDLLPALTRWLACRSQSG